MRARNIKPGFFENEELADLPPLTRLLYIGLWLLADREGRLENRPRRIKAQIFPYERRPDIPAMLTVLERSGFVRAYGDEGQYLHLPTFLDHQHIHPHERATTLPDPGTAGNVGSCNDISGNVSLNLESLNPELGISESPKDESTISSEPAMPASEPVVFIRLPVVGNGKDSHALITEDQLATWTEAYPGVDVPQQLRSMEQWLITNPARRKTSRGVGRFVTSWLAKTQDGSGTGQTLRGGGRENAFEQLERMKREGKIT